VPADRGSPQCSQGDGDIINPRSSFSRQSVVHLPGSLSYDDHIDKMLDLVSDDPTNEGEHVTSNVACFRRYTKDSVF